MQKRRMKRSNALTPSALGFFFFVVVHIVFSFRHAEDKESLDLNSAVAVVALLAILGGRYF